MEPNKNPIDAGHMTATAGTAAALGGVLMWISKWPLQPLDGPTSLAAAALLIGVFAAIKTYAESRREDARKALLVAPPAAPIISTATVAAETQPGPRSLPGA